MSSGSTLRLFSYPKNPSMISEDLFGKYMEKAKEFHSSSVYSLNGDEKPMIHPKYMELDEEGSSLWIKNELQDLYKVPTPGDLRLITCIGGTDFGSDFTCLIEHLGMSPYDETRCFWTLSEKDISDLVSVFDYLNSDLKYRKDAASFEEVVFQNNEYFRDLIGSLFPSRYDPGSFKKGDPELLDEESYGKCVCKNFSTFLNYYRLVHGSYELPQTDFELVYFSW